MFNFLKEKLKNAVSVFTKKVEEEVDEKEELKKIKEKKEKKEPRRKETPSKKQQKKELLKKQSERKKESKKQSKEEKILEKSEEAEQEIQEETRVETEQKEEKGFFGKIKGFFEKKEEKIAVKHETEEPPKKQPEEKEEKKGFLDTLGDVFTKKTLSDEKFEELFDDLEILLLENNVAVEVIEKIKEDMRKKLVNQRLKRGALDEEITHSLTVSIDEILSQEPISLIEKIKEKKDKPLIICFFGINGSGKTTSIAKLAHYLKKNNLSVVLAAADTFRAAAIDQLQMHGDALGVKVIKQQYGADAAAVAFDAIHYSRAHKSDVVLIDTAGRSHANVNLMDELKKIIRVAKPDLNIFVGDSLTGNDMVEQAQKYGETVGIDGIILAKADADEKGGATISASYVTKKPILFMGSGQRYTDLEEFSKEKIMKNLGLT